MPRASDKCQICGEPVYASIRLDGKTAEGEKARTRIALCSAHVGMLLERIGQALQEKNKEAERDGE